MAGSPLVRSDRLARALRAREARLRVVMDNPDRFRFQARLVVLEPGHAPELSTFREDAEYFYPASTVKLPIAIAALRALRDLGNGRDLTRTPLRFHPLVDGEPIEERDPTNIETGYPTAAHSLRRSLIVSDNHSSNRLYDLVGHAELHASLHALGLHSAQINHRLSDPRAITDHRRTPRVDVLHSSGTLTIPARQSNLQLVAPPMPGLLVGSARMVDGTPVEGPMDFSTKNRLSLADSLAGVAMVACPETLDALGVRSPGLVPDDLALLLDAITTTPSRCPNPRFDPVEFPDHAMKPMLRGLLKTLPPGRVRCANKLGQAYGFTTDAAHLLDTTTGRGFLLAATIYTNANGVLGDDRYEYQHIGEPTLETLAQCVAEDLGWK